MNYYINMGAYEYEYDQFQPFLMDLYSFIKNGWVVTNMAEDTPEQTVAYLRKNKRE